MTITYPAAGLVVLHPDVLLSGTLVSGSYKCPRASVIQERFGGSSGIAAVQGTLLHELFQADFHIFLTDLESCLRVFYIQLYCSALLGSVCLKLALCWVCNCKGLIMLHSCHLYDTHMFSPKMGDSVQAAIAAEELSGKLS